MHIPSVHSADDPVHRVWHRSHLELCSQVYELRRSLPPGSAPPPPAADELWVDDWHETTWQKWTRLVAAYRRDYASLRAERLQPEEHTLKYDEMIRRYRHQLLLRYYSTTPTPTPTPTPTTTYYDEMIRRYRHQLLLRYSKQASNIYPSDCGHLSEPPPQCCSGTARRSARAWPRLCSARHAYSATSPTPPGERTPTTPMADTTPTHG